MRWTLALTCLSIATGCSPRPTTYPIPVWETVQVPAGTTEVTEVDVRETEPRLPTRTGRIAVRLTRASERVPLAPDAFAAALERWLDDHQAEVRERMGARCAERARCIEVLRWPSVGEEEEAPAGDAEVAPPSDESGIDWVVTAEIVGYDAYTGTLSLDVRARAPGAEEPALSGPIEAPDLATIAAQVAGSFLPGEERVEIAREEPTFRSERRVVSIRRRPVR